VLRLAVALATLAAVALARPAAAGAAVVVESERRGDVIEIRATAVLNSDPDTAWRVLTDYNRYTEFIPDLRASHVVARHGTTVTVEQSGEAALGPFRFPMEMTFEIHETPPHHLDSRAVAGTLRALMSSYSLTPVHAGTRLDYIGHVRPGFAIFGGIEQAAAERNVARQFQALADEIERWGAAARSPSTAGAK
jgi:ribosome-associated toxin RatA of RatAB toxin-antitoxin module